MIKLNSIDHNGTDQQFIKDFSMSPQIAGVCLSVHLMTAIKITDAITKFNFKQQKNLLCQSQTGCWISLMKFCI